MPEELSTDDQYAAAKFFLKHHIERVNVNLDGTISAGMPRSNTLEICSEGPLF